MKKLKKFYTLLVVGFFFIPLINFSVAEKENFVGIDEEEVYLWEVDYDDDVFDHWAEDFDVQSNEVVDIEDYKDLEAIKINITDIDSDVEEEEFELVFQEKTDDYEGVDLDYDYYETEDYDSEDYNNVDWDLTSKDDYFLFKFDNELYMELSFDSFNYHFIDEDPDWGEVVDTWEDLFISEGINGDVDENDDGISLEIDITGVDLIEITTEYGSDGVLDYYEFKYDEETLLELELKDIPEEPIPETIPLDVIFWIIIVLIIVGTASVALTVVIIITMQNRKKERPYFPEHTVISRVPKIISIPIKTKQPTQISYCPACGNRVLPDNNFCQECGIRLNQ